jgi:[acyl-carrier-protein] S-malonyltransferase
VPLVGNVTARPESAPDRIRARLVEQVTGRVRWRESVAWMAGDGVSGIWEIGAGKALTGMVRRIDKSIETRTVGTAEEVRAAAGALAG